MEMEKTIEIFDSLGVIDVSYKGNSVWIENIYKENNEAEIKDLKTGEKHMVNVSELQSH